MALAAASRTRRPSDDREKLQERLTKLVGGVAIIKVGAATETEMKDKKARVEERDARDQGGRRENVEPWGGGCRGPGGFAD